MTTADPVSARLGGESDLDLVAALAEMARAEAHPTRGGRLLIEHDYASVPPRAALEAALAGVTSRLWVGDLDGVPVGYATASIGERGGVRLVMIEEIFVHPDARGVGVAAALLAEVQDWALAYGAEALESQVLPGKG